MFVSEAKYFVINTMYITLCNSTPGDMLSDLKYSIVMNVGVTRLELFLKKEKNKD